MEGSLDEEGWKGAWSELADKGRIDNDEAEQPVGKGSIALGVGSWKANTMTGSKGGPLFDAQSRNERSERQKEAKAGDGRC